MTRDYLILAGLFVLAAAFYFSHQTVIASFFFVVGLLVAVAISLRIASQADDDDEPRFHQ